MTQADARIVLQFHPIDASQRRIETVEPGVRLGEFLDARTPPNVRDRHTWTVRVNGVVLPADEAAAYVVRAGDLINARVRARPPVVAAIVYVAGALAAAASATAAAVYAGAGYIAAGINYAAGAVGLGGIGSVTAGGVLKFAASVGFSLLSAKLAPKPPRAYRTNSTSAPFYSLSSTRNEMRRGGTLPTHYGTMRVVPDIMVPPITSISSDGKVSCRYLYCVGVGHYDISDIRLGNTPIADLNPSDVSIYYGSDAFLPPAFVMRRYTTNIVDESVGVELRDKVGGSERIVRSTAQDSVKFTAILVFAAGIWRSAHNGKNTSINVRLVVEYRDQALGGAWTRLHDERIEKEIHVPVVRKISSPLLAQGQYEVAVQLLQYDDAYYYGPDQGGTGGTAARVSGLSWLGLQSHLQGAPFNEAELRNVAMIGIELQASERLSGALDQINCLVTRRLRRYDGAQWLPTTDVDAATNNPAWAMADPLIERDGEDSIDADEIKRWADYCEDADQDWEFSHSFTDTSDTSVGEAVRQICAVGQATYVKRGSLHSVALDEFKTAPVALFTGHTIQTLTTNREDLLELHAARVTFVNSEAGYVIDELTVYLPGYNRNNSTEIQVIELVPGVTRVNQLHRHMLREIARRRLRSRIYEWTDARYDGLTVQAGDLVELCVGRALRGLHELRVVSYTDNTEASPPSDTIDEIVLSEPVVVEAGREYGLRVALSTGEPLSIELVNPLTAGKQLISSFEVAPGTAIPTYLDDEDDEIVDPLENAIAAFGDVEEETVPLIVIGVTYDNNLHAQITAVDYAPQVQTADSIPIPTHVPVTGRLVNDNNSAPPTPSFGTPVSTLKGYTETGTPIFDVRVGITEGAMIVGDAPSAQWRWQWQPAVEGEESETDWRNQPTLEATATELVIRDIAGLQLLNIRAWGVSSFGVLSEVPASVEEFSTYSSAIPTPSSVELFQSVEIDPTLGARPTLEVSWIYDPETPGTTTRVRHRRTPSGAWVASDTIIGLAYTIGDIEPGDYEVEVRGQRFGEVGAEIVKYATVFAADVPATKQPSGLELFISGVRQGNSREFTGRSVGFVWNAINYDASLTGYSGADEIPPDRMLTEWDIRLLDPTTREEVRRSRQPASQNFYSYDFDAHVEDGLRRSIRLELRSVDRAGNQSQPAILVVSNSAPATPTGVSADGSTGAVIVSADRPADPDLACLLVWASDTAGFTPDDSTLVAVGADGANQAAVFWTAGRTVYYRVAWCDAFSREVADLNLSPEDSVDVPAIPSTQLDDEVRTGLSAAYTNKFDISNDIDDIALGTGGGTVAASLDYFSPPLAALFTWGGSAPSDTANDTPYLLLPVRSALAVSNQRVRVKVWAKKPSSNAATSFRVALDTGSGSSGWQTFSPSASPYLPFEFLYQVPVVADPAVVKLRVHADSANSGKAVLIDSISIIPLIERITDTNRDDHLGESVIDTTRIEGAAVSGLYEVTDTSVALFTGSDASTWKTIVDLSGVDVVGQNPGDSPVLVGGAFSGRAEGVFGINPGANVVFKYRIVRNLGEVDQEVIYESAPMTVTGSGYGIGGARSPIDLVPAGVYTYTLQAQWYQQFYTEGTARFVSGGAVIEGSGTRWLDFFDSGHEIRLPSITGTWFPLSAINSNTNLSLEAAHGQATSSFVAYELRWDTTEKNPSLILNLTEATLQVLEQKR